MTKMPHSSVIKNIPATQLKVAGIFLYVILLILYVLDSL